MCSKEWLPKAELGMLERFHKKIKSNRYKYLRWIHEQYDNPLCRFIIRFDSILDIQEFELLVYFLGIPGSEDNLNKSLYSMISFEDSYFTDYMGYKYEYLHGNQVRGCTIISWSDFKKNVLFHTKKCNYIIHLI